MKPSERIMQLEQNAYSRGMRPTPVEELAVRAAVTCQAIADYLDEQHEAQAVQRDARLMDSLYYNTVAGDGAALSRAQQRDPVQNAELIDGGLYVRARAVQGAAETLRNLLDHWGQMTPERAKKGIETALSELTGDTK
jgi:hypothetical protein